MQITSEKISLAIIGLGARGLGILERILCFASLEDYSNYEFTVDVIDPGLLGAGVHTIDQEDYMLLNTPVYLPTMFPGNIFERDDLAREGLSFEEWFFEVYQKTDKQDLVKTYSVQPGNYLPRRLMGEYLNWVYEQITAQLPRNVTINIIQEEAISLSKEGENYIITISNGSVVCVRNVFITIGHADRNDLDERGHKIIKNPYPVKSKFRDLTCKKVALAGMGLVAFDIISELSIGRGGHFTRNANNQLEYKSSGREPIIYLFSKQGVPYRARPLRESEFDYQPIRLTREAIQKIREKPEIKLDFMKDVMPLIYDEMSISYYLACVRNASGERAVAFMYKEAKQAIEKGSLQTWLHDMGEKFGSFHPKTLIYHDLNLATPQSYKEWIEFYLKSDIQEARKGPHSPLKCAVEVMLQVREGIREAVEFDGLTEASALEFFYKISPLINKNSIGPELQRIEELLALIQSGIVNLSLGPNPKISSQIQEEVHVSSSCWKNVEVVIDLYCEGYLKILELDQWHSKFVKSMISAGVIQSNNVKKNGLLGIQIDRSFCAIPANGIQESRIWILGVICEGTTYYNNYVPITWQGIPSTPFVEAHTAVNSFFSSLNKPAIALDFLRN